MTDSERAAWHIPMGTRVVIAGKYPDANEGSEGVIIGQCRGTCLYNVQVTRRVWRGAEIAERYAVLNYHPCGFEIQACTFPRSFAAGVQHGD